METNEITEALRRRLDIERLRPMQERMIETRKNAVMLAAPTGSGKTVAFGCYLLRRCGEPRGQVQAVVTVPSRELALQVADVMRRMASGLKTTTVYGGHRVADELPTLTPAPDILIATPGRLLDLLQRGALETYAPATVVVDEFDKTLDLGFAEEMSRLMRRIGRPHSLVLTSATPMAAAELPQWAQRPDWLTLDYSTPPEAAGHLERVEVESPVRDKAETLADLLCAMPDAARRRTIVFVNHRESAERLHALLTREGIENALYHGGLQQNEREAAVALLRGGSVPVLVATDLAARGLDIEGGIDAVVHYHMPPTPDDWTHRNGRTARNGADGTAYVITAEGETVPDYVVTDRRWLPAPREGRTLQAPMTTLHINAGRKEKISRGDVVGYITAHTPLKGSDIGLITLTDHATLVAVPREAAASVIASCSPQKLKGQRVRLTRL